MLSFKDFERDGKVDWRELENARRRNGESCMTCGALRIFAHSPGECEECEALRGTEEASHKSRIRCPHCGHIQKAIGDDNYERYGEGEHSVSCHECDKDFEIETHVRYSFTSPARSEG